MSVIDWFLCGFAVGVFVVSPIVAYRIVYKAWLWSDE